MRRTSFAGALAAIAIGAILAFAIQSSPKDFDVQAAGLILVIAGAGDLLVRTLIADSPLLSRQSAGVAAVLEPVGDPVLDAAGNPIRVQDPAVASPGTMPPAAGSPVIDGAVDPFDAAARMPSAADLPGYAADETTVGAVVGDPLDTPESPVAVTTLTGRPVRPRGRGLGGARPRRRRR